MALINAGTGIQTISDNTGTLNIQCGGVTGVSINSNGMYVKSVTTTQMTALTPVAGMVVFNTTLAKMCMYVNGAWQQMTSAAPITGTQRAIFGFGSPTSSTVVSTTNLVSNLGVVSTDTTGVGTARMYITAATYGGDKAIFGYGSTTFGGSAYTAITNLVSNAGVVATDTAGVGTLRRSLAATGYGTDRAIFGYGFNGSNLSMTNLVSNTGVGSARYALAGASFGS